MRLNKAEIRADIVRLYDHNIFFHDLCPTLEDIRVYFNLTNQQTLDLFDDPIFFLKIRELIETLDAQKKIKGLA